MKPSVEENAPQLLLVDIGNTRVGMAIHDGRKRGTALHLPTEPFEPVERAAETLWLQLSPQARQAVIISSVCPPVLERFRAWCDREGVGPIAVIGQDIGPPIDVDLPAPEKVGTDRLCVAAAAYEKIKGACVVADFGTALTIDLVSDDGAFLGGAILPGIRMSARALHEQTALLPLVEVGEPCEMLGKDTVSAIRNGIFAMMCGALREVTERYATDIGRWPPLVATGGDAGAIAKACDFVDHVAPDLCLDGVALAFQRAMQKHEQR